MNRKWIFVVAAALLGAAFVPAQAAEMSEKEKALASPYPNDFGPEKLDDAVLKSYPAAIQDGYKSLIKGCAQCHSAARPLNSRFVEPEGGKDEKKQEAALAEWKKSHPEMFKDQSLWQPEARIWSRYVKRMMSKPGCEISQAEGKKIYEFLVYDGVKRKTGANAAAWAEHRKKLISEFKAKHPKRYEELKAAHDL